MEKKNIYSKDLKKFHRLHTDITTGSCPMIHPVCDGCLWSRLGDLDINCQALDFSGIIQLNHLCFLHSLIILSLRLSWRTDLNALQFNHVLLASSKKECLTVWLAFLPQRRPPQYPQELKLRLLLLLLHPDPQFLFFLLPMSVSWANAMANSQ